MGAKVVISPTEHKELDGRNALSGDRIFLDLNHAHEYATVPTNMYAMSAPRGPAT